MQRADSYLYQGGDFEVDLMVAVTIPVVLVTMALVIPFPAYGIWLYLLGLLELVLVPLAVCGVRRLVLARTSSSRSGH